MVMSLICLCFILSLYFWATLVTLSPTRPVDVYIVSLYRLKEQIQLVHSNATAVLHWSRPSCILLSHQPPKSFQWRRGDKNISNLLMETCRSFSTESNHVHLTLSIFLDDLTSLLDAWTLKLTAQFTSISSTNKCKNIVQSINDLNYNLQFGLIFSLWFHRYEDISSLWIFYDRERS